MLRIVVSFALFCWLPAAYHLACGEELPTTPSSRAKRVDFARDIQPVLAQHCLKCHGPSKQESSFRVDLRKSLLEGGDFGEPAVKIGKAETSHLIRLVTGADPDTPMPPEGERLTAKQINLLRAWIDQGLKMPQTAVARVTTDHWSFQPVSRREPARLNDAWINNSIDSFILQKLRELGLKPSPPAARDILIRRIYLDMLGLLPSPEEVQAFTESKSPTAYEELVERALASPHYGERWARHWLDVVRFAESNGFETNHERPTAFHYRDWVIRSLNDDKPYDQFVFEQLAGDSVGQDAATGFLVGGPYDRVRSPDPVLTAMQRQDEMADIVNTTGTAFLGLTLGCARCHSHKFDPILQKDYYSLQAVFAGVQHGERELRVPKDTEKGRQATVLAARISNLNRQLKNLTAGVKLLPPVNARLNEDRFAAVEARFVRFTVEATNSSEPCLDELEVWTAGESPTNVALSAAGAKATSSGDYQGNPKHKLQHINDGKYGNERSWISNTAGRGWVQIELPKPATIDRITWGRDRNQKYKDRLATRYRIEVSLDASRWQRVAESKRRIPFGKGIADPEAYRAIGLSDVVAAKAVDIAKQIAVLEDQQKRLRVQPKGYVGQFVKPPPTHRLFRGDPMAKREQVAPNVLEVLFERVGSLDLKFDAAEQQRRVSLAKWMTNPKNPLTARVIVNRLWHYHFGRGIVETPSDFGAMGAPPSHPELLDSLAAELVDNNWSLKHIHRQILLSSTYRQSSASRPAAMVKDKDASLLWRFPPRRLEAEAIRDNILLVSGALDHRMFGPGFMVFQPNSNYSRNWIAKDEFGPAEFRRLVYALQLRMERDAVFGAFDCPDGGQIAPKRSRSTTPIQALNLFNSKFIVQQAEVTAKRIQNEVGDDASNQVRRLFELALGRMPRNDEFAAAADLVHSHGLAALCRAMFNTNEFLFLP